MLNILRGFVLKFGALSCLFWTSVCVIATTTLPMNSKFHIWILLLPLTAYILVCAQALQQFDQRSSGFKLSGISELLNRLANNGLAIVNGLLSLGGPCLILAVGVGQATKILVFKQHFRLLRGLFSRDITLLLLQLKGLKLYRLNGSLIFSHLMLSVTAVIPLTYIALLNGVRLKLDIFSGFVYISFANGFVWLCDGTKCSISSH